MFFSFAKRSKLGETVTCFVQFCISWNCQPYYPYIHLPRVSWYSLNYLPPESGCPQSLAARKWVSVQSLAAREWVSVQSLAARVWVTVQSFAARELRIRTITCRHRVGYPYNHLPPEIWVSVHNPWPPESRYVYNHLPPESGYPYNHLPPISHWGHLYWDLHCWGILLLFPGPGREESTGNEREAPYNIF